MLSIIVAGAMLAGSSGVAIRTANGHTELTLDGAAFHSTNLRVSNLRTLDLAGGAVVALWAEGGKDLYAISLNGTSVQRVSEAKETLEFQYQPFDPKSAAPYIPERLKAQEGNRLFVVQFETQTLDAYRDAIKAAGGEILSYIPNNAYVVRMDPSARAQIEGMSFVRYVGNYEPVYRLDPRVISGLLSNTLGTIRYSILLADYAPDNKSVEARKIEALGGVVNDATPGGRLMEATLTPQQLIQVANSSNVLWINPWGPYEPDMNIARIVHGTDALETATGYTGQGVRGMVRDGGLRSTHVAFQHDPPIILSNTGDTSHGTSTYGIIFGDGTSGVLGRGVLPDAQGVFRAGLATGASRWNETNQAINSQSVVFESNSTGSPRTFNYEAESANMDDIIFDLNILICQSQSNAGNQDSRPQAWAKNMVSVGGVYHFGTTSMADDRWNFGGSIGPASDGRIKPDLASFYDQIYCTSSSSNTSYTSSFGGTSGATPITCGHFGLLFQMWSNGVFNNTAYGTDVFSSKCNAMTAKAMMINTATQWTFSGAGHDLTRVHQGWGHAQIDNTYNLRDKMFIVDQSDVLAELDTKTYRFYVAPGETAFRATMAYRDLPGNPAVQSQHRVNDLTLRVVDPGGTEYWGNNGLKENMWSTSGGTANTKDTVENVYVQNPATGVWTVEVSAPELNGDSHPETPAVDSDYALVVTGVTGSMALPTDSESLEVGNVAGGTIADTHLSDNTSFNVRPGVVLSTSQAPVRVIKEVVAPTTPGDLWIVTEASTSSNNVDERIELWNWGTNSWNLVATHTDMTNVDTARSVFISNPASYTNGSNHIRVRCSYIATGPTLAFPWQTDIDHIRVAFAP